jgi:hypothetical protein
MLRLAAVKEWCGGKVVNYLIYYSKPNSDDPYTDVENMIQHLKLTENLGKIYLDFQRHVVRGIIDQKDKIR